MTFTLGHTWPMVREVAPLWDMTPTWQSEWTEADIRKEECRRLVWSSVMLTAGHSSYTAASPDIETQQLFLMDPRNVSVSSPLPTPAFCFPCTHFLPTHTHIPRLMAVGVARCDVNVDTIADTHLLWRILFFFF